MLIDLSELSTVKGTVKTFETGIDMKSFSWEGDEYPFSDDSSVMLEIEYEGEGTFRVRGNASLSLEVPCSRCLSPVKLSFKLEPDQYIDTFVSETERIQALDIQPFVQGHMLDTDLLVCDELCVNMPMKVLCSPDCKGLCPKCGANRNIRDCGCDTFEPDPRMSVISDLFRNFKDNKR